MEEQTETSEPSIAEDLPKAPETASLIDRADKVAERMEQSNKQAEELLKRQEAVAARMMLGGKSEAGELRKTTEQLEDEKEDKEVEKLVNRFK